MRPRRREAAARQKAARYCVYFSESDSARINKRLSMIVPSQMIAPLVWLGVHQVIANMLLLSSLVLSGIGMFVLVRSLTRHVGAALVAGLVFAFLPYRLHYYQRTADGAVDAVVPGHCTGPLRHGRLRDGILAGAFFTLQTLSSP